MGLKSYNLNFPASWGNSNGSHALKVCIGASLLCNRFTSFSLTSYPISLCSHMLWILKLRYVTRKQKCPRFSSLSISSSFSSADRWIPSSHYFDVSFSDSRALRCQVIRTTDQQGILSATPQKYCSLCQAISRTLIYRNRKFSWVVESTVTLLPLLGLCEESRKLDKSGWFSIYTRTFWDVGFLLGTCLLGIWELCICGKILYLREKDF